MCSAKNISDNKPLVWQTMKRPGTFNKSPDSLLCIFNSILSDLAIYAVHLGIERSHGFAGSAGWHRGFGCRHLSHIRLQNLSDVRPVGDNLGAPVFGTQSGGKKVSSWRIFVRELVLGRDEA